VRSGAVIFGSARNCLKLAEGTEPARRLGLESVENAPLVRGPARLTPCRACGVSPLFSAPEALIRAGILDQGGAVWRLVWRRPPLPPARGTAQLCSGKGGPRAAGEAVPPPQAQHRGCVEVVGERRSPTLQSEQNSAQSVDRAPPSPARPCWGAIRAPVHGVEVGGERRSPTLGSERSGAHRLDPAPVPATGLEPAPR
jgi:hypothetical protein